MEKVSNTKTFFAVTFTLSILGLFTYFFIIDPGNTTSYRDLTFIKHEFEKVLANQSKYNDYKKQKIMFRAGSGTYVSYSFENVKNHEKRVDEISNILLNSDWVIFESERYKSKWQVRSFCQDKYIAVIHRRNDKLGMYISSLQRFSCETNKATKGGRLD